MKRISIFSLILLGLSGCDRLSSIPYFPKQTPESWLRIQPFINIKIGTIDFILMQPSSTVFVYLLGIITLVVGLLFLHKGDNHQSRKWWGIALLLWGFGALFAGTSYQAFSYEIKCVGQALCSWTSWWEIVYLVLSAASIDAMVISSAYSSYKGKCRTVLVYYALLNITLYIALIVTGVLSLIKFLISFELLLTVTTPNILLLFILNGWRYFQHRDPKDFALLVTWIWLGAAISIYFTYLVLGITDKLWEQSIWFSENDVLHLGLISWMIYIGVKLIKQITDDPTPDLAGSQVEV
jgi:hypothetical protein